MDKKKTKLTISGNFKKSFKNLDNPKFQEKKSVFVNKTSKPKLSQIIFRKPYKDIKLNCLVVNKAYSQGFFDAAMYL